MKHLTTTYIFLLIAVKASVATANIIENQSPVSSASRRFNARSTDARTILFDKRELYRLLPRLEDNLTTLHRRSGRGGSQSPPRSAQRPPQTGQSPPRSRSRSQSPDDPRSGNIQTPLASAIGYGPARVTPIQDGHIGTPETYEHSQRFEKHVQGQRQAAAAVETFSDSRTSGRSTGNSRSTGIVDAVGQKSAKVYVNASDGGFGRIHRMQPPPRDVQWVLPGDQGTAERIANRGPQTLEVMGSITGKGQALAEAKDPEVGS